MLHTINTVVCLSILVYYSSFLWTNLLIHCMAHFDILFQTNRVDGLHRWNKDRERAANSTPTNNQSYSGPRRHTANFLGLEVKVAHTYEPRKHTGKLFASLQ